MLGELYKYAIDNGLSARPGFKQKKIKYYICFTANGDFLGLEEVEKERENPFCPDMGSTVNSQDKCNIIVEKAEVIFNLPDKDGNYKKAQKQQFYMESMRSASDYDAAFKTAVDGIEKNIDAIIEEFKAKKGKAADFISLKVDGTALESTEKYLEWWEIFRKSFNDKKEKSKKNICYITGEISDSIKTVPPVQGLNYVGGHTKGDSLICFDKSAYMSYGFNQAENASVSEEGVTVVNSALNTLFKNGKILAGAKNIHWFSQQVELDPVEALDFEFDLDFSDDNDNNDDDEQLHDDEIRVKKLFNFITSNERPNMPENRYYMMSMSGVNGRIMIRSYDEGKYDELCENIIKWYDDIALEGKKYPKLSAFYMRMIKFTNVKKDISERMKKEIKSLSPRILYAVMHGTELPDTAAQKVLMYIHSDIYASSNSDENKVRKYNIDTVSCQFLKAYINRKYRKEKKEEYLIMEKLNKDNPSKAYLTGRLMAVYAAIQRKALGDVGAGVVERFYTSACSAPALVIGKLSTMSQYHLSKMEKKDYMFFNGLLQEVTEKIGCSFPKTFDLAEQSEFALGYYQQNAEIYRKKEKTEE